MSQWIHTLCDSFSVHNRSQFLLYKIGKELFFSLTFKGVPVYNVSYSIIGKDFSSLLSLWLLLVKVCPPAPDVVF